ncbi:MAG: glycosyltransferase [Candidatus Pacebacteria bacterium]|nr:glycosyltransferase [Candidatus Paceibacterota bacterium]
MKPIPITFVINDFSGAGAQKLIVGILAHIDRTRFRPVLITLFEPKTSAMMYHLIPNDVEVVRLSFRNARDIRSWLGLYRALKRVRPNVVVSQLFFSNTACRILKPFLGYAAIATEQNTYTNKSRFHQYIDRALSHVSYAIVAVSTTVKTFTAKQEGIAPSKFRVIYNATDTKEVEATVKKYNREEIKKELDLAHARIMINAARLSEQKNHMLLLRGFARVAHENEDLHLVILGEGEKRGELESEARLLSIDHRVHFLGYRDDVYRYYAGSDFFISTSRIEGLSLAYIEALSAGLPILSTQTSGTDEMVEEGVNGFFIREHTPEAVAEGLNRMLTANPRTLSDAARISARRFDIVETTRQYENLMLEAIAQRS